MTEYTAQRQLVAVKIFKVTPTESDDFKSISHPSKLIGYIIDFLYRDLDVVGGLILHMEMICMQQGLDTTLNEAGRGELHRAVDWLRHNFNERHSGNENEFLIELCKFLKFLTSNS